MTKLCTASLVLGFALVGCATVPPITITAMPEGSSIIIDGKVAGTDTAEIPRTVKFGFPSEHRLKITNPGHKTLTTTIKSEFAIEGAIWSVVGFGFGAYYLAESMNPRATLSPSINQAFGILELSLGAWGVASAFKFDDNYDFELETKN